MSVNEAARIVEPYFAAKWHGESRAAEEALAEAKAAAVRCLQQKIEQIRAMEFEQFKSRCLHESVQRDTRHTDLPPQPP